MRRHGNIEGLGTGITLVVLLAAATCHDEEVSFAVSECRGHRRDFEDLVAVVNEGRTLPQLLSTDSLTRGYYLPPVREYHDCQRLIVHETYGPVVGLYRVEDRTDDGDWRLAAIVENTTRDTAFDALGIPGRRRYCLWLQRENEAEALLLPCSALSLDAAAGRVLATIADATQQTSVMAANAQYPRAARWGMNHGTPYIEISCERGWCGVGEPPPPQADLTIQTFPRNGSYKRWVSGWYDQQVLAISGPDGRLMPGGPLATFIPVDSLQDLDVSDFTGRFVHVATIYADGAIGIYAAKYGLDATPGARTDLYLLYDRNADTWRAKLVTTLVDGSTSEKFREVTREAHPDAHVPGTARFAWRNDDERLWVRCGGGCCEVEDDE